MENKARGIVISFLLAFFSWKKQGKGLYENSFLNLFYLKSDKIVIFIFT